MNTTTRQKMLSAALGGLVMLVSNVVPSLALATQVFYVPPERMARESAVVVYAEVGQQQVSWNDERTRIITLTELNIITAVKGAKAGPAMLYQVGGALDGTVMEIPGALVFTPGERIVLFAQNHNSMLVTFGIGQGKYRVVTRDDGKLWAEPEFGDVAFVERRAGEHLPARPPEVKPQPLEKFLARMQQAISADYGPKTRRGPVERPPQIPHDIRQPLVPPEKDPRQQEVR